MISLRRRRQLLLGILVLEAACIVAAVAVALAEDVEVVPAVAAPVHASPPPTRCTPAVSADPAAYAAIYQCDIRQGLTDSASETTTAPALPPALSVRLVGTVLEANYSYAILRGGAGEVSTLAVGESQGGVEVLAVGDGNAVVRFGGRPLVLSVAREENR